MHAGFHLHTVDGQQLSGSTGLAFQNVRDGAVLTLTSGIDDEPPRVYDDVVEAMADVVERELQPWEAERRPGAPPLLRPLYCCASARSRRACNDPSVVAGALAGVVAIVLTAAAVVLARVEKEHEVALLLAWAGVAYGAVCGLTVVEGSELLAEPLAAAGGSRTGTRVGLVRRTGRAPQPDAPGRDRRSGRRRLKRHHLRH